MSGYPNPDEYSPRILVFSTINISDPGIDLAGSRHLEYPATVQTMAVPCSSGLKPSWLLHALDSGFDGVFIASDGEECAYLPDCAERTSRIVSEAQAAMTARGLHPQRLKMAAVCSVCAEPFAKYMREFYEALKPLGRDSSAA
ncbi:MAG: hydrogenase iron-sulfur subunit [Propionibacteriaceae bacterium]|nr:hydrogenase iron-sulfur subunit [Propionibacteriaceae bacterium]